MAAPIVCARAENTTLPPDEFDAFEREVFNLALPTLTWSLAEGERALIARAKAGPGPAKVQAYADTNGVPPLPEEIVLSPSEQKLFDLVLARLKTPLSAADRALIRRALAEGVWREGERRQGRRAWITAMLREGAERARQQRIAAWAGSEHVELTVAYVSDVGRLKNERYGVADLARVTDVYLSALKTGGAR